MFYGDLSWGSSVRQDLSRLGPSSTTSTQQTGVAGRHAGSTFNPGLTAGTGPEQLFRQGLCLQVLKDRVSTAPLQRLGRSVDVRVDEQGTRTSHSCMQVLWQEENGCIAVVGPSGVA